MMDTKFSLSLSTINYTHSDTTLLAMTQRKVRMQTR